MKIHKAEQTAYQTIRRLSTSSSRYYIAIYQGTSYYSGKFAPVERKSE